MNLSSFALIALISTAALAQDYTDHSPATSRARYINAIGTLDRAWGSWTLLVRYSTPRAPELIIGIDTEARCRATACGFGFPKMCKPPAPGQVGGWEDTAIKYATCYQAAES